MIKIGREKITLCKMEPGKLIGKYWSVDLQGNISPVEKNNRHLCGIRACNLAPLNWFKDLISDDIDSDILVESFPAYLYALEKAGFTKVIIDLGNTCEIIAEK